MGLRDFSHVDYQGEPLDRPLLHDSSSEIPPFLGALPSFSSSDGQFVLYSKKVKEAVSKSRRATGSQRCNPKDARDADALEAIQSRSIQPSGQSELPTCVQSVSHFGTGRQVKSERFFSRIPFSMGKKDVSITEPLVLTSGKKANTEGKRGSWYTRALSISSQQ